MKSAFVQHAVEIEVSILQANSKITKRYIRKTFTAVMELHRKKQDYSNYSTLWNDGKNLNDKQYVVVVVINKE